MSSAAARAAFLREMGLTSDDVANPDDVLARKNDTGPPPRRDAKASGAASGGGGGGGGQTTNSAPAPARRLHGLPSEQYERYVTTHVDKVISGRDDEDEDDDRKRYAPAKSSYVPAKQTAGKYGSQGPTSSTSDSSYRSPAMIVAEEEAEARRRSNPVDNKNAPADDEEEEPVVPKYKSNLALASAISAASLQFSRMGEGSGGRAGGGMGGGKRGGARGREEDDDDDVLTSLRGGQQAKTGGGGGGGGGGAGTGAGSKSAQARAEFLRSLGIDNADDPPPDERPLPEAQPYRRPNAGSEQAPVAQKYQRSQPTIERDYGGDYEKPQRASQEYVGRTAAATTTGGSRTTTMSGGNREDSSTSSQYQRPSAATRVLQEEASYRREGYRSYDTPPSALSGSALHTPVGTPHRGGPREPESPTCVVNELLYGGRGGASKGSNATTNARRESFGASTTSSANGGGTNYNRPSGPTSLNSTFNASIASAGGGAGAGAPDAATDGLSASELKDAGNAAFEKNDFRRAVRLYSKAIALEPSNAPLYSNRSAAYLQASKQMGLDTRSMALRDAEKVVELMPRWFKGHSRHGDALFKLERFEEAIAAYEAGLALDPDNTNLMHSLGEARNASGGIQRRGGTDSSQYASERGVSSSNGSATKKDPYHMDQQKMHDEAASYSALAKSGKSSRQLAEESLGTLNDAVGSLVIGDEYRKKELERFRLSQEAREGSNDRSGRGANGNASSSAGISSGTSGATTHSMTKSAAAAAAIRASTIKEPPIPAPVPRRETGNNGAGRGAPTPYELSADAGRDYQSGLLEQYRKRKQEGLRGGV